GNDRNNRQLKGDDDALGDEQPPGGDKAPVERDGSDPDEAERKADPAEQEEQEQQPEAPPQHELDGKGNAQPAPYHRRLEFNSFVCHRTLFRQPAVPSQQLAVLHSCRLLTGDWRLRYYFFVVRSLL